MDKPCVLKNLLPLQQRLLSPMLELKTNQGISCWLELNQTVSLNGTKIVPLNYIDTDGLGQLNLNYVDPDGSHQKITGTIFTINHDPAQPKAVTWNQNALTSSSPSTTSSQQAASTSTPFAPTTSPSSTTLSSLSNTVTSSTIPQPPTFTSSTAKTSSSFRGGYIVSIVLGIILGILVTALLIMLWIRWQRKKRLSEQDVRMPSAATPPNSTRYPIQEKDAITVPNELLSGHERWELPADRHGAFAPTQRL